MTQLYIAYKKLTVTLRTYVHYRLQSAALYCFIFPLEYLLTYLFVWKFFFCICMHQHTHAWGPYRSKEVIGSSIAVSQHVVKISSRRWASREISVCVCFMFKVLASRFYCVCVHAFILHTRMLVHKLTKGKRYHCS